MRGSAVVGASADGVDGAALVTRVAVEAGAAAVAEVEVGAGAAVDELPATLLVLLAGTSTAKLTAVMVHCLFEAFATRLPQSIAAKVRLVSVDRTTSSRALVAMVPVT
mmetsp:Transcript_21702/g.49396  ORF Transcript_21702/g.49396 Transcript_21702/m.49396 type:complete len:108 (+) Transcript_21702:273-596(+)